MKLLYHILLLLTLFLMVGCQNKDYPYQPTDDNFIQLKDSIFTLKGEPYFPIMLNYVIEFKNINNRCIVTPAKVYEYDNWYESKTEEAICHQLRGHFQLIKEMGFNTIRVCCNRLARDENYRYYYQADNHRFYIDKDKETIVNSYKQMLNIAEDAGLHVMLLIREPIDKQIIDFTQYLLSELSHQPTLFAYDFMNEPLYFDNEHRRNKKETIAIVEQWRIMVRKYAPNQLFTIGFAEPSEVHAWDPSMLPVDFIAFHTYHPLRVLSEIYWYSTYVNKPWMLGETSLPADNDSISYDMQRQFMREVYHYVRDCGGIGFGWWEFQEIPETEFEAQYTALLNHEGTTHTKEGDYEIKGTVKPAVEEIAHFAEYSPKPKVRPVNYFNNIGYNNYLTRGQILDAKSHQPIEGAVIRGWNNDWSIGQNTYTDSEGRFTLYSNDCCTHFMFSAPGMNTDLYSNSAIQYQSADASLKENELPNRKLKYLQISFQPFLKSSTITVADSDNFIFNFDERLFHQYKFETELPPFYLSKIKK